MLKEFKEKDYIIKFDEQRVVTTDLIKTLTVDDMNIQTEEFVSPTKWHLAHTTWFFEKVIHKVSWHPACCSSHAKLLAWGCE